ncbi:biopolymer transporter ExbD [Burkholderia multivorans]|jgi:biopolymer transport protein ExbD|uniref:ExbD/TolR family protein n=1 Tax=Burkholderia multivorans TaxID=87883 RepID=UPI001C2352CD|nr:biopolymer transporter ExbD [Burkholderia multivorans]MBU9199783.1 biopolymer transporter ExbD [Burkholderia multivorans]MDN8079098.1 biopolymer transporter ExbD [Burkholderia multivorans]
MAKRKVFNAPVAEINIIPLLDVLLVLVAVLLLLTPFMAKSINVDLPSTTSGAVMTQDTAITFEVHADGSVWMSGHQVVDWSAVQGQMKGATTAKVFADKGAAFVAITQVLDKLAANDIHNVQFATKD